MRCALCLRTINAPTKTITTSHGLQHFGPVCAQRMGLRDAKVFNLARAMARLPRARAITPDFNQLDLLEAI